MPLYEWTCKKCGATLTKWDSYTPEPRTYRPCPKKIATPDFDYIPVFDSHPCTFTDPVLKSNKKPA